MRFLPDDSSGSSLDGLSRSGAGAAKDEAHGGDGSVVEPHQVVAALERVIAEVDAIAAAARSCRRLDDERLTRVQVLQGALSRLVGGLGVSVAAAIDARCGRELGREGLASRHGQRSAKA